MHDGINFYNREVAVSFGTVDVIFSYYPPEAGNCYEPPVPEELSISSVYINDCEVIGDLDEDEFFQVREAIFKLLEE